MPPFFSIVIPTYNHKNFLEIAIKSVFSQTFNDWELIVIDNHSNDGTESFVLSLRCEKIKYLKIHNSGVIGTSRNKGAKLANGKWICFLDSDDFWHPKKLESVHGLIQKKNNIDVIVHDELLVSDDKFIKEKKLHYGPIFNHRYDYLLLYGNKLSTSATSIRRQILIETGLSFSEKENFTTVEDYDLWLKLAEKNATFYFFHKVLGYYVSHSGNNSKRKKLHNQNHKNLLRHHIYNIQTFEVNKDKLWKNLISVLDLKVSWSSFDTRRPLESTHTIMGYALTSPLFLTKFVANRIKDKIINKILFIYHNY